MENFGSNHLSQLCLNGFKITLHGIVIKLGPQKHYPKNPKAKYLVISCMPSAMINVAGSLIDCVHSYFTSFWPAGWIEYFALLV